MIHLNIITLGKLKEEYWREAESEYLKRLSAFAKINIFEIKEESFSEKDPIELIKKKEKEKILAALEKISARGGPAFGGKDSYIITLEEKGKQYTSVDFSKQFTKWSEVGRPITIIIGGPLGLDPEIVQKANTNLSLSLLTFTHQMTRVILLEQIYRAVMIAGGRRYHY